MRLLTKYSRLIIGITLTIFLVAILAFYFTLKYVQLEQMDADLKIEEEEINSYVKQFNAIPTPMSVNEQVIQFSSIAEPFKKREFKNIQVLEKDGERELYRQLTFGVNAGGKYYLVRVSKSLEVTENLVAATLIITAVTIICILIALVVINRVLLKKLWRPFYQTLDLVKDFKVGNKTSTKFPRTDTKEFSQMISTLDQTINQANTDYLTLKTFSENASHEIQTPLAVIRSKIDLLIQDEGLTERQDEILQTVSGSIQKLSRLNSSLLLLAKIENNQFTEVEPIDLKEKVAQKMSDFQELWQMKNISVDAQLLNAEVKMNKQLADILLNNLFSNATRHNSENGNIAITLQNDELTIKNSSNEPALDRNKIFQRFYKPTPTREHNGLGLSIIKQICETFQIKIEYQYLENQHGFKLNWNNIPS